MLVLHCGLMMQMLARAYHYSFNLRVTALRFFSVYGPMGRPDTAFWMFSKVRTTTRATPYHNIHKYIPACNSRCVRAGGASPTEPLQSVLNGVSVPLFVPPGGDAASTKRDFTFVDDAVSGLLQAMDHGAALEVFNLGANKPHAVWHAVHHHV